MARRATSPLLALLAVFLLGARLGSAQLRQDYYADTCPKVESIVRSAVEAKFQQTFQTVTSTLRLFFHDCMINGCDASVIIQSTDNNKAEKDHPDNVSLAGDGFDTVIKAKEALEATPGCQNKVSCADILALATRDVVELSGGPRYPVELGRLDGLSSTAASVEGNLPQPGFNLDQLTKMFESVGLNQTDVVALSAAHTVGFAHCAKFSNRLYDFDVAHNVDPTMDKDYAAWLQSVCPTNVDPHLAVNIDAVTPKTFDNQYYKNLQVNKGLFSSDQVLYTDTRTRSLVDEWASSTDAFYQGFANAMTRLGRVGVKTKPGEGNIRKDCSVLN